MAYEFSRPLSVFRDRKRDAVYTMTQPQLQHGKQAVAGLDGRQRGRPLCSLSMQQ